MLQIKSFQIIDGERMSEFLKTARIASGANILISNGVVAIPYEDGNPMSTEQKVLAEFELLEGFEKQRDLMVHSQKVLDIQAKGIEAEMEKVQATITDTPKGKADYDANKAGDAEVKRLTNVLNQTNNQILMNQAELTRIITNIAVHNETIATLKGEDVAAK